MTDRSLSLPDDLVPAWGRLPRLSLVAASGSIVRERGRAHLVLAAPAAVILFMLVLAARVSRQLAAGEGECSLVIVLHRRWARTRLASVVAVLSLVYLGVLAAVVAWFWWGVLLILVLLTYLVWFLFQGVVFLLRRAGRRRRWMRRGARRTGRERVPSGAIALTSASSWPRGQEHGRDLWERLVPVLQAAGRPVVAKATDPDLAASYAKRGAPPGNVSGDVVIWLPA